MTSFRKDDVVGKTVIETTGRVQGKVTDVMFDLSGGVTLIVEGGDDRNSQVPLTRVTGISEHVVIRSDAGTGGLASSQGSSCRFCGASLTPGEKWCPSCGKAQL